MMTAGRRKVKKNRKKKYIWCGLSVLLILGSGIAFWKLFFPGRENETAENQPRTSGRENETAENQPRTSGRENETAENQPRTSGRENETTESQTETAMPEVTVHNDRRERKLAKYVGGGLYFVLILGICIMPMMLLWVKPTEASTENRKMASLPEIQTSQGFNWNFLPEAGAYFTDHFVFRQEMVSINAGIRSEIFGVSAVEDVIVGENGWLYYAATLDDYQHRNSISERMLFNIAHNMALMQEYSEELGMTFIFTIAPNKNSLYDENMPRRLQYQLSEKSDAQRLQPWLISEDVNYVDLFELFEEQEEILYYARDSHWNEKGAVMVYNALLDACGKQHETYEEAEPIQRMDYFGDLGVMLFPVGGRPETRFQYPIDDTWHYVEGEKVEDTFIRTENEVGEGNLLMYRDSFGNSLLPYMAQTFSRTVFSKQVPYSMSDLVTCEPDILIVEKVERQLPTLGKVPPMMSAPVRETEKARIVVENTAATVHLSKEGSYWKLEGTADSAYMNTGSHIYVEVDDGNGAKLYEAFCVSSSDMESASTNDYGYILYVSEVLVTGDIFKVRVMIEQEEAMVVLLQKELSVLQESSTETCWEETEKDKEEAVKETEKEEVAKDRKEEVVSGENEQSEEEQTLDVEQTKEDNKNQTEDRAQTAVKVQTQTEDKAQTEAEVQTQTEDKAQTEAEVQAQAEAQAQMEAQAETQNQDQSSVVEVGRIYVEDCGTDSGYWVITYSDGHVEYLDD